MTRIPTYSSYNMYISRMLEAQSNVYTLQTQLATEQKSQSYVGIASDTYSLLSVEVEKNKLNTYINNNQTVQITLESTLSALEGMNETMRDFRDTIVQFTERDLENLDEIEDEQYIDDLQQRAFDAMKSMEFFLNQKVDGKYLFGGGQTNTSPVDFGYSSIEEFQAVYDGEFTTFPESRSANLSTFSVDGDTINGMTITQVGDTRTIDPVNDTAFLYGTINQASDTTGDVRFASNGTDNDTIYSDVEGAFSTIEAGGTIVIANGGANDGVHYVEKVSADGRTITLKSTSGVTDATVANGSGLSISQSYPVGTTIELSDIDPSVNGKFTVEDVTISGGKVSLTIGAEDLGGGPWTFAADSNSSIGTLSYYQGDNLKLQHKASDERVITIGVNAEETAFEKAIRAMGILAQDKLVDSSDPTEAGRKIQEALDLINDALDGTRTGSSMASEIAGSVEALEYSVTAKHDIIENIIANQESQITYIDTRVANIEGVDITEIAVKLQHAKTTLEVAYATIAQINELSLLNYL